MEFTQFAGLELLKKSYIKNLVIEKLDADPTITELDVGRIWFNTIEKRFKVSILNDFNDINIVSLSFFDDINSVDASLLIGYEGKDGIYDKFNIPEGSLKSSLDLIVDKIDENTLSIDDINNGTIYNLQDELNSTQYGAGLSIIDGSYTADPSANYIDTANTLFNADQLLDAQLKIHSDIIDSLTGSIHTGLIDNINDINSRIDDLQSELDFTQTIDGCGLAEDGSYTPNPIANYIDIADNLFHADQLLDTQIKDNTDDISVLNNTNIFDISEDIYGDPLWKGDKWPVRDDLIYKTISSYKLNHVIAHNLDTQYILVNAWIKDPSDGKFKSDIVNVIIENNNNISIELSEPRELMLIIEAK